MKRSFQIETTILGFSIAIIVGFSISIVALVLYVTAEQEIPLEEPPQVTQEATQEPLSNDLQLPVYEEPPMQWELPEEPVERLEEPVQVTSPMHITVDAIGVDHPIINIGLNDDGSMEIPHDVNELGWYEPGIKPGEYGSAVITGHVDSRSQGRGAFFDLRLLEEGHEINIIGEDGEILTWDVERITRFHKDATPMDDIFRWEGETRDLVLVTCGGEFDRTARSYQDNIVVYASFRE